MKILYIVPSLVQAGPVNVALDLVRVMQYHGHSCDVAYFDDISNRPLNKFPCKTFKVESIQWNNYDVIHTHGFRPDLLTRVKMPKNLRKRTVSTMHNLVFEENKILHGRLLGWCISRLELWAAAKHKYIITLTNVAKDYYLPFFKKEKLKVCCNTRFPVTESPDPIDIKTIEQFKAKQNLFYLIGSHCSVTSRKGIDQIINALPSLPDIGFVLIGTGPEINNLKLLAKNMNVSDASFLLVIDGRIYT